MSTKRKKCVFVMIDGLADVNIPALGFKTPLQVANTPNFDKLARAGVNGLMDPVEPGLGCGSDTAHMSIFGYPPRTYYRGRGAFESMGAGLDMQPGDIAFKSNFATIDPATGIVLRRRCDRNFEQWGPPLCDFLTGTRLPNFPDCQVDVKYATEHRCGVRVRGPGLTDSIKDTDPLKDNLPLLKAVPLEDTYESKRTAALVNELSQVIQERLSTHPLNIERAKKGLPVANVVLLRGCGARIQVPSFQQRHGIRPFMIAPTAIIAGLGMSLEIPIIRVPGTTGDYKSDLGAKARAAIEHIALDEYDFGFVHVKAVDDTGHDRNTQLKVTFLERIDREIIAPLLSGLSKLEKEKDLEFSLVLTGDHSTPVEYGDHSSEPVPFVIAKVADAARISTADAPLHDPVTAFSEIDAARGLFGRFPGAEVMPIIKTFAFGMPAHSAP